MMEREPLEAIEQHIRQQDAILKDLTAREMAAKSSSQTAKGATSALDIVASQIGGQRAEMHMKIMENKLHADQVNAQLHSHSHHSNNTVPAIKVKAKQDYEMQHKRLEYEREMQQKKMDEEREWRQQEAEARERARQLEQQRLEEERQWRRMQAEARDKDRELELRRIELEEKRMQQQGELMMVLLKKFASESQK